MKKIFLLTIAAAISMGSFAQGNSNRAHQNHKKDKKEKKVKNRHYNDDRARNDDWRNRDSRDGDWRNRDSRDGDWRNRDRNDDNRNRDSRNGDWRTGRNDNDRNNNRRYDENSGQAPRKVKDAFYRDYPNANNVTWTKDRGVWSARFKRSGLFGGNTTVSYRANGERVNNNVSNVVFNRGY